MEKTTTFSVCPIFPSPNNPVSPLSVLCSTSRLLPHLFCHVKFSSLSSLQKWQQLGSCNHQSCLKRVPSAPPSTLPWGYMVHKESKTAGVAPSQLIFAIHNKLRNPPFVDGKNANLTKLHGPALSLLQAKNQSLFDINGINWHHYNLHTTETSCKACVRRNISPCIINWFKY